VPDKTNNRVWSDKLWRFLYLLNFFNPVWKNIKSSTEFESWVLFAYYIDINLIGVDFSFSFIYFSWFNISFLFYFDDKEAYDCDYITCHMMWGYKPKLGKSRLERTRRMMLGHVHIA